MYNALTLEKNVQKCNIRIKTVREESIYIDFLVMCIYRKKDLVRDVNH